MKSGVFLLTALVAVLTSWAQTTVSWTLDLNGETPSADGVYLVGSFNGWILGADALTPDAENPNYYHISKDLAPGVHEYKFVNGLDWSEVEPVPEACQFDESTNRWVEVQPGGGEFELSYCWNRCASCQLTSVLFRVNMEDQPIDPAGVHVAGDFQVTPQAFTWRVTSKGGTLTRTRWRMRTEMGFGRLCTASMPRGWAWKTKCTSNS